MGVASPSLVGKERETLAAQHMRYGMRRAENSSVVSQTRQTPELVSIPLSVIRRNCGADSKLAEGRQKQVQVVCVGKVQVVCVGEVQVV